MVSDFLDIHFTINCRLSESIKFLVNRTSLRLLCCHRELTNYPINLYPKFLYI